MGAERTAATPVPVDDPFDIMLLGWSFMRSRLLMTALDLDLFRALEEEMLTADQVVTRLGLHPRGVRDFLDALAALGILERRDGAYRNTPAASQYLLPSGQKYVGGFLTMTADFMGPGWEGLETMLRTGEPHGHASGTVPFAQIFRDPERLRRFLSAMDSLNGTVGPELVRRFDWSRHGSFVDIGGARGNLAAQLLLAHPHLKGAVFDRPVMRPFLEELAGQAGVAERIGFHGGDFFVDELPGADVLVFGNVLHDCPVDARRDLIARAARAVSPGGAVVVYDPMIDDGRRSVANLLLSLTLMVQSRGGSEYTPAECRGWMEEAGLVVEDCFPLPARATAMVGRRAA
ncbi:methyltransferase [Streptomyces luteireticuli]|uniref:methyltransferase n=1 Tax=Streptomyces luteireticuli TaxID=173858 RepID=UPI003558062B